MTDFSRLDSADNFLAAVSRWVGRRVMSAGAGNWNHDPAQRETRERSARMLARAAGRRIREQDALIRSGVPDAAVGARLRANSETRTSRVLARYR